MKLLLQSNRWDCLPTAFAMCMDILPVEIFEYLGHDGSEKLWPELEEPYCYRSFHIEEMIDFALSFMYCPVMVSRSPYYTPKYAFNEDQCANGLHLISACFPYGEQAEDRFLNHISRWNAVLLGETKSGKPHAVAWCSDEERIFDPEGFKYPLDEFKAEIAYLIL